MIVRARPLLIALAAAGVLTTSVVAQQLPESKARVTLVALDDGGTPRDPARIVATGEHAFRVRASVEEGQSPLTHAVSRVDLVCRNEGNAPVTVTLDLDLSGEGGRPNFDTSPFGGMPLRDFLFVQPPGKPWRQVDGKTSGWIATMSFEAPPGETKIGLSPWYTYSDYLAFVKGLPEHPHLKKAQAGTSDGSREIWELTITDPAVPASGKRTIFWHAREHAYETFSSFAMEGLIAYLLSDEAAEARRRYVIVVHPMTNVDGVAQGHEYRGGYDHPDAFKPAAVRVVRETLDRLRPEFIVAWHNWIAPRDRDVVFYTHQEDAQASRRAWDLFTQRFPSPRSAGHRWNDETTPLKYNWFGRRLVDENVHQHAAKRYGSHVWGWEMPWWRRSVADARRAGEDFGRAYLTTLDALGTDAKPKDSDAPTVEIPRWEMHEFVLRGKSHVTNPFRDAALVGEFTSPSGKSIVVEGFYDGDDTWRLRFTPDEEGEWRYRLRGEGAELSQLGRLRCTAASTDMPRGRGFIRIHPDNPYAFAYADGTPFFPMGDTCYGLLDDSPITPELRASYLRTRRSQRFNFVRMSVGHSAARASAEPADYWAFGGTPAEPDLDRFNPAFFRGLDKLLRQMQAEGMNAELLLINLYRRPFTDPQLWTPERERLWLRYLMARYSAFPNIFLWTIANEYETHPDGKYRLDVPDDPAWAKATARFIKQHDPYRHPVTVHPVVSATAKSPSPKGEFDRPWRIGEFFGEAEAIDVLSQQTGQAGQGVAWDEKLRCWTGDDVDLVASLRADRRYQKPVLNTENGYEYLRGHPTEKNQVHHTDKVRRTSWRIVCAGGYFASGFHGTIGHSDAWNRIDAPNHYTFAIEDEGAAAQLAALHDFFTALPFWQLEPFAGARGNDVVALAEPGKIYMVYLPHGGQAKLDLRQASGNFSARWFNPRDGKTGEPFAIAGDGTRAIESPDRQDWALILKRAE